MLSAFVVVSLSMLQQDTGQASVGLLLQLSAQTANSSQPVASLPDFQPPRSAIWINSVWFLSLILSLTSALFGMIAKQWLREYMEWTTTSWQPHNTITLRQKRFEAFNEWKIPAIIAAIPALLEIALILFFVGLIVFLWTFDVIVGGVVASAIAASISLAILVTVLPVFCRRCPYQSPTGWACLLLVWPFVEAWENLRTKATPRPTDLGPERLKINCFKYKSWRDRDFDSSDGGIIDKATVDVLGGEVYLGSSRFIVAHSINHFPRRAKTSASKLAALRRAFLWIRETSQTELLLSAVEECAITPVANGCPPLTLLALDFSAACQALRVAPVDMCKYLDMMYEISLDGDRVEYASLRHGWIQIDDKLRHNDIYNRLSDLCRTRPQLARQLAKTLAHDLNELIRQIIRHINQLAYPNEASARFVMRIAALCALVTPKVFIDRDPTGSFALHFRELLKCKSSNGLTATLFELASSYKSIVEDREFLIYLPSCVYSLAYVAGTIGFAKLALSLGAAVLVTWNRESADLFCRISAAALRLCLKKDVVHDATAQLLACMTKVAKQALSRECPNCGSYSDLAGVWLDRLYGLFEPDWYKKMDRPVPQQIQALFPHELVASLARCRDAGLLTGDLGSLDKLVVVSQRYWQDSSYGLAMLFGIDMPDVEQVQDAPLSSHRFEAFSESTPHRASPTYQRRSGKLNLHVEHRDTASTITPVTRQSDPDKFLTPAALIHHPASDEKAVVVQGVPDASFALRQSRIHSIEGDTTSSTAEGDIELQDLTTSPSFQVQSHSHTLLAEDYDPHIGCTPLSTSNVSTAYLLGEPPDTMTEASVCRT